MSPSPLPQRAPTPEGERWRPSAGIARLRARAGAMAAVRAFFAERGVMEVDTPVLASSAAPDANIECFQITGPPHGSGYAAARLYLQSSPEVAMKRLLAAGSGPIYQFGKAFRRGEAGRYHNPEFTLLEWYRPGFQWIELVDELDALLDRLGLPGGATRRVTYRAIFVETLGLDPFTASDAALRAAADGAAGTLARRLERAALLDLLMAQAVQPRLGAGRVVVHDFPAAQAALARVRPGEPPLAERFEMFVQGVEVANGYQELLDAREARVRLEALARASGDRFRVDQRLLAALPECPDPCAGVAVGFDRLVLILTGAESLAQVLSFAADRA